MILPNLDRLNGCQDDSFKIAILSDSCRRSLSGVISYYKDTTKELTRLLWDI